jgi:hypothetical protein
MPFLLEKQAAAIGKRIKKGISGKANFNEPAK